MDICFLYKSVTPTVISGNIVETVPTFNLHHVGRAPNKSFIKLIHQVTGNSFKGLIESDHLQDIFIRRNELVSQSVSNNQAIKMSIGNYPSMEICSTLILSLHKQKFYRY